MKKVHLALMPLMAVSFLASCGGNGNANKSLEDCSWQEIQEISKNGQAQNRFKVGDEKIVKVGGVDHKVRIIGFNHDYSIEKGGYVGITFEFANMISDSSGLSLATFWDDFEGTDTAVESFKEGLNYWDSSVRAALVGKKGHDDNATEDHRPDWFRYYGEGNEKNERFLNTEDPYYHKSVYDLLPDDLKTVIAPVVKPILYCTGLGTDNKPKIEQDYISDPLFLLSSREMGCKLDIEERLTYTYEYYAEHTGEDEQIRIKKQVDDKYSHIGHKAAYDGGYVKDTEHADSARNYAGCVYMSAGKDSTGYWTRSISNYALKPCVFALRQEVGHIKDYDARQNAFGVAPAFCI